MAIDWDKLESDAKRRDTERKRTNLDYRPGVPSGTTNYVLQAIKNGPPRPATTFAPPTGDRPKSGLPQLASKDSPIIPFKIPFADKLEKGIPELAAAARMQSMRNRTPPAGDPSLGQRLGAMATGGFKGVGGDFVSGGGAVMSARGGTEMTGIYREQLTELERDKAIISKQANDLGATPTERREAQEQLAIIQRRIETYAPAAAANEEIGGKLYDEGNKIQQSAQADTEKAKQGLGKFGRLMVDAGTAGIQMGTDFAVSALTGGAISPSAVTSGRMLGSFAQQAKNNGATADEALNRGVLAALTTYGVSKLSSVSSIAKAYAGQGATTGFTEKIISNLADKLGKSAAGKTAVTQIGKLVASGAGEGLEEMLEDAFNPVLDAVTYKGASGLNDYADAGFYADMLYDGLVGGVMGIVGGGLDIATKTRGTYKGYKESEQTSQLLNSPESGTTPLGGETTIGESRAAQEGIENASTGEASNGLQGGAVTPESKEVYRLAGQAQGRLDSLLAEVAGELGIGFESAGQKSIQSMMDKVARKNDGAEGYDLLDMKDHARGKLELPSFDRVPDVLRILDMKNIPYSTEAIGPTEWGYRGLHLTWRNGQGIGSELQITRPDVWKVKLESDRIYDKWRNVVDASKLLRKELVQYRKDMAHSKQLWGQLNLPDFMSFSTSSSDSVIASNSSFIGNGERAGFQEPSKNSIIGKPDWSMRRPDSVIQAIKTPPFQDANIIPQNAGESNSIFPENSLGAKIKKPSLPQGTGAKKAEFGYNEAPTQSKSTDYLFTDAEKKLFPEIGNPTHQVYTNKHALSDAQTRMDSDYEAEKTALFSKDGQAWGAAETVMAQQYIDDAFRGAIDGHSMDEFNEGIRLLKEFRAQGTREGQAMQIRKTLSATPSHIMLASAEILQGDNVRKMSDGDKLKVMKQIENQVDSYFNIRKNDTNALIEVIKQNNEIRHTTGLFSKDTSKQMNRALNKALEFDGAFDFLSDVALAQIRNIASDYLRISPLEAIKTYRVMGMLSKASTIMRNLVSNNIFDPIESLSTNMAVPIDILLSKKTGTRTTAVDKSWFSEAKRRGSLEGAVKSFIQVGLDADVTAAQSRYELSSGRVFKMTGNIVERILSTWSKMENYALLTTDELQKGGITAEAQRGLDALSAAGKLSDSSMLSDRAAEIAKQRTFQSDGVMSETVIGIKNVLNENLSLKDKRGGSFGAGDLAIPFAKVPANIAAQGANYSPVGLVKGIVNLGRTLYRAHKGTLTPELQARAVMDISRGLNGTAGIAMFTALAVKGIISVAGDDDKDKEALERGEGRTGTQLNVSAFWRWVSGGDAAWHNADTLTSIGFLEPVNAQMAAGAFIADAYKEDKTISLEDAANASVSSIVQSVLDLPAMSQINELVNGYRYSKGDSVGEKTAEALTKYVGSQASSFIVPNFVRGVATATDDTVRNTYSGSFPENTRDSIMSGIPGLRKKVPASLDSFGNERKNTGNLLLNALNANILPGQIGKFKQNAVGAEIERLNESTGSTNIYPSRKPPTSIGYDGEAYTMNAEDKSKYFATSGKRALETMQDIINNGFYDMLSDEQKATVLSQAIAYGNDMAKREFLQGKGERYKSGEQEKTFKAEIAGIPPADYFVYSQGKSRYDEDGDGKYNTGELAGSIGNSGLSKEKQIKLWALENPDWLEGAKKTDVALSTFVDFKVAVFGISADKDKAGKTILGSKKEKVIKIIDRLNISAKEKDALYFAEEYAASTLYTTPWH